MDQSQQTMHDDGFTLTEVLVAFAILSLTVILGLRAFGSGVLQVAHVEDELSAIRNMEEVVAAAQIDKSTPQAPRNSEVMPIPLTIEKSEWSSLVPHLVVISRPDGKGEPIETILIRRLNDE